MKHLTKWLPAIIFVMSACATAQTMYTATDNTGSPVQLYTYRAPAVYEVWWQEIAACEQLPLPADHIEVKWVLVPARPFYFAEDSTKNGYDAVILTPDPRVYVTQAGILNRLLIEHEMEHYLLFKKFGRRFVGKHPQPYYSNCGLKQEGQLDL